MRFELVTLFPEFFEASQVGLLGKAIAAGHVEVQTLSPREFATDKHRTVDDAPYGGGSGMVLMAQPVVRALEALDSSRDGRPTQRVLLTPQGEPFAQRDALRLSKLECVTIVCGRYEGFDERVREFVDEEISLGDFVLLGGETAALALIEATARLLPGVLGNTDSTVEESHQGGLLEYPQYTRPPSFRDRAVPDILLSGDHVAIATWRKKQSLRKTLLKRPDLLAQASLDEEDLALIERLRLESEL